MTEKTPLVTPAAGSVAADMTEILSAIQNQRIGAMQQIAQVEAQVVDLKAQVARYDSLIALLQVGITEPATLAAVEKQKELIGKVPLTSPSADPAANAGGNEAAPAQGAGAGAGNASDQSGDAGPAA